MAEETQEDLSMEDILSSIRNILIEDNADQQAHKNDVSDVDEDMPESPLPEDIAAFPDIDIPDVSSNEDEPLDLGTLELPEVDVPSVDEEPLTLEDEPLTLEDDILDLSSSMIIDGKPQEKAPVADIALTQEPEVSTPEPEETTLEGQPELEEAQEEVTLDDIDFTASLAGLVSDEIQENNAEEIKEDEEISLPEISLPEIENFAEDDDNDPTDGALLAAAAKPELEAVLDEHEVTAEEPVEETPAIDADFSELEDAEPIFAPEENVRREFDANQIYEEASEQPVIEEIPAEEEPLVDNDTLNEILNLQSQVKEAEPEPTVETVSEPEKESDAIDVSASIISNFAKMFADKKEEQPQQEILPPAVKSSKNIDMPLAMPLGGGNLTLEDIVKDTVSQIVEKNLQSVNHIATQEISRQTKAWLDANLPKLVEAVVKQEIERVMVKVGR